MMLPRDWFAVSAGDTLADATALGRHPQGPHAGAAAGRHGGVEMHQYTRVQRGSGTDGGGSGSGGGGGGGGSGGAGAGFGGYSSDEHGGGNESNPLLNGGQGGGGLGTHAAPAPDASASASGSGSGSGSVDTGDEYQREIAAVRQLLRQAGDPPPSRLVWELSQRLKRAAGRHAVAGGEAHEALTEECVRLRLLSRQLRRKQAKQKAGL